MIDQAIFNRVNFPQIVPSSAHGDVATTGTASTLTTLTYTAVSGAGGYLLQPTAGTVRMTLDGTTPTTAKGFRIGDGQTVLLSPGDFALAKFITETGSPRLQIQAVR